MHVWRILIIVYGCFGWVGGLVAIVVGVGQHDVLTGVLASAGGFALIGVALYTEIELWPPDRPPLPPPLPGPSSREPQDAPRDTEDHTDYGYR